MSVYRVTVARHYIDVKIVDVVCSREQDARGIAERAVQLAFPDVRAAATDNGWHGDNPLQVDHVGYWKNGTHPTRVIGRKQNVYLITDGKAPVLDQVENAPA